MGSVLVVAEQKKGVLVKASLHAVSLARQVAEKTGGGFDVLVLGAGIGPAAEALKKYGAGTVFVADSPVLANYLTEAYAAVIAQVATQSGAGYVCAATTATAKDLLPRVAGKLGAGMASDVTGVNPDLTFQRPMYAGNAIATVAIESPVKVLSVRGTAFAAAAPVGTDSPLAPVAVTVDLASLGKEFVRFEETKSERPELTEARIVVSGGRGCKDKTGFDLVGGLADMLGGAMGTTRAVVDAGLLPNDLQVGQTGKVVAPELYVAVGLSGAIQHWAGMRDSKVIVAINKDEEAPIISMADYSLVADLFKAVPELHEKIKAKRG